MGVGASNGEAREIPNKSTDATLYYFAGRGLADQIRWMLAVTAVSFSSHVIDNRARFTSMASSQLPFGQLPLLQIDKLEIVQSQACVRYLARRGGISGSNPKDEVECDMIAEACKDLISVVANAPFRRTGKGESESQWEEFLVSMKAKWAKVSSRFEAILIRNGGTFMVGQTMTYADVLVAHSLTWFVEEGLIKLFREAKPVCFLLAVAVLVTGSTAIVKLIADLKSLPYTGSCGSDIVTATPMLVALQNRIVELPQVRSFIRSSSYYPVGGEEYVRQVSTVLKS